MYLKSFDIQGFKSFPDKTTLAFNQGVTAVVGPNGSGKSNIAEAVRWVLGEQSPRALRCEKRMEEIIFHGTAHRGPVGFAEVSLLLDNSGGLFPVEQDEVLVTRRLYRSGESEYFLNKANVRLRDVLELFMDTGLGKDGYCLIGQGRIGEILSDKGGDRRRIFEEASGISRYRHRKEEAERKLSTAEDNLTRIGDKIEELELQVSPLREQAEVARQYLRMRDELRSLEINLWLDALQKLRSSHDKVRDDYRIISEQLEAGQASVTELYAASEALLERDRQNTLKAEQVRTALSNLETETAETEGAVAVLQASWQHNEENMTRIRDEQAAGQSRDGGIAEQIRDRETRLEALRQALASLEAELQTQLARVEEISTQADSEGARLDALRAREATSRDAAAGMLAELSSHHAVSEALRARRETVAQEISAREAGLLDADKELGDLDRRLTESTAQLESLQNVIAGYEMRRESRRKKAEELRGRHDKASLDIESLRGRIKLLSDMEREQEGQSRAVKVVIKESQRGSLHGVHGTVADLIRVDDRYAVAVEIALGPALQNIIVDREEDAKAAIETLRRMDVGRATFLPLSSVRGRVIDEQGLDAEPGFMGVASELVRYDVSYRGVLESLLGRTVVVESMDAAIGLARRRGQRFRIVTLEGQVISPGGAMTGGSVGKKVGILSRKNELERLEVQCVQAQDSVGVLAKEREQAERELAAISYDCEVAQSERRVAEDEALSLRSSRGHKGVWRDGLHETLSALQNELTSLDEKIRNGQSRADEIQSGMDQSALLAQKLAQEIAALSEGQTDTRSEGAALAEQVAEARAQMAAMTAERLAEQKAIDELNQLRAQLLGDQTQKEQALAMYEAKNKELLAEINVKQNTLGDRAAAAEAKRDELEKLYAQRQELEGQRVSADRRAKEQNEENMKLERERSRLEGKKAAGEAEEKAIIDRLWDHYGLTHSVALEQRTSMESISKATRRAGELKNAIAALGPPNIGAIDEYERVSERYEYLTTQRDDAAQAKADLLGIIDNITEQMKDIFSGQFTLINEKFGQTFKDIFGGGDAHLELEDPEDILNCGVEIKAQPPGKKMRSITLLSGGEKSLVAIALYFSIFRVRPAPFCVLDEVDHDLDDVNVARYAAYLQRLSKEIQFVVITHRRGTMEAADILYGVTTQEEGVSKILSLRLQDAERSLGMQLE